jgi:hypothetical protein
MACHSQKKLIVICAAFTFVVVSKDGQTAAYAKRITLKTKFVAIFKPGVSRGSIWPWISFPQRPESRVEGMSFTAISE